VEASLTESRFFRKQGGELTGGGLLGAFGPTVRLGVAGVGEVRGGGSDHGNWTWELVSDL
jgi:hypothetical protein